MYALGESGSPVVEVVAQRDGDRGVGGNAERETGCRNDLHKDANVSDIQTYKKRT